MTLIPHFAAPFAFSAKGVVNVTEQDSQQEISDCIFNVASCFENFREDLPEFGIPDLTFEQIPLNLEALQAALNRWEPRAELTLEETEELMNPAARAVSIEVF